ncbi:LUCI monooxygenase, partial [Acromyrmex charruanus]
MAFKVTDTYIIKSTIDISKNINHTNNYIVHLIDAMTEEQTTYQQMRDNSVKCALWFKQLRCEKNIIAMCTNRKMLEYIPFLASLYVGSTINSWDKKYMKDNIRILYFLLEYKPNIIFIDSENYKKLKLVIETIKSIDPPKIVTFDRIEGVDSLESILNNDFDKTEIDTFSCKNMHPLSTIASMFSPGATRYPNSKLFIPKVALMYPSNQEVPVMSSGDIGLWYASLNWSYGVILTIRCIISYVTAIKCSIFSDKNMYETIEKYKVSWIFLESKMCRNMINTDIRMYDISSLKQLVIDDSTINFSEAQQVFHDKFMNVSIVQVYSIMSIIFAFQRRNLRLGSSGYVAKNVQLQFSNIRSQKILGPFRAGIIWYKLIFKWCSPKTCKLPNFNQWHCTGDYGYYERDGEIFLIDKVKDLIKYRIFHLSPARIENALLQHSAVSEVTVRSVPHIINGHHPVAYVKKKRGAKVTEDELIKFAAQNLPEIYQLRGGLQFKASMPHLPNGKVDRMLVIGDRVI